MATTVAPSATAKLGAVTSVMSSVLDVPESEAAVRLGMPPVGAVGYRAHSPVELKLALERALNQDGPIVIEVPSEPGSDTSPWPFIRPSGR